MKYPRNIWNQLKGKSADELIRALKKDGWQLDISVGAEQVFRHPSGRRVSIHYHPHKTFGPNLLKALLEDIGWDVEKMKKLKLVK
ncbi:MAG: type II toxin-antitoxin system HicA family toxin [Acidobacteriota bacterium]